MKKYSKEWFKEWFIKASIRAIYTFSQGLLAMSVCEGFDLLNLEWGKILLSCLIMALLSYAKSFVIGVPEMKGDE